MEPSTNSPSFATPAVSPASPPLLTQSTSTQNHKSKRARKRSTPAPHLKPKSSDSSSAKPSTPQHSDSTLSLDSVQIQLQMLLASGSTHTELVRSFVETNARLSNALWSGHFVRNDAGQTTCSTEHSSLTEQNLGISYSSLLPTVAGTLESGKARVTRDHDLTVIATPVFIHQQGSVTTRECFCIALNLGEEPAEPFLLMTQMVSATLSQWHAQHQTHRLDWQIDSTTAITELMSKIVNTTGRQQAAIVATNELATFLKSPLVAIGYVHRENSKRSQLQSISGVAAVDRGGKQTRLIQAALNETLLRGNVTATPTIGSDDRCFKLAHDRLLQTHPDSRMVSSPLISNDGKMIGAWICVLPNDVQQHEQLTRFASATSSYLADALYANQQASLGVVARSMAKVSRFFFGQIGKMAASAALAIGLIMMLPLPHRINCECQLTPTVRRYAVAPHDGILLESIVEPGDLVSAGQVIARMDQRELLMQLSDVIAQRETAIKKRDVNRSSRDAAATQIADLEIDQLDAQLQLLNFRKNNLEIRSTIAGIVLHGELEDTQGAPVRAGDILMEIAPLDELRLELNVPDADIAYLENNQPATFVLDGAPLKTQTGKLSSIRPAAEVRNNKNVFVAEIAVDNSQRLLRPGMQGRAKITAGSRALGWILFHRPVERVYKLFR